MKSKKFVLAALVLLAITGLLALTSCKNDSVPERPAANLVSISVTTPPARTVYSVGQEFDSTGMVVTATYDDKSQQEVTGWTTNFGTVVAEKGLGKEVTVSYKERETTKTTTFTVTVFPKEVKVLTGYTSPNNTDSEWTYVTFGEWPQTIKDADVTVYETESKKMGMFTYYLGDDDNYYVKITAKPYVDTYTYTYSDGSPVEKDAEVYFKVEPIVWRVLTEDYKDPDGNSTGNALLLAEGILTGGIPYYVDTSTRAITGAGTVYPNNWQYSTIRAWLNGSYEANDPQDKTYTDKGFLQTAFTESARKLIAPTSVDNSAASTNPASNDKQWNDGKNEYASDTPTTDKIFLLSEEEATTGAYLKDKGITEDYGFDKYDSSGEGSTRIRVPTDYAKATGAEQNSYGRGMWWLRSPYYYEEEKARVVSSAGIASVGDFISVIDTYGGVVPALSISLQ